MRHLTCVLLGLVVSGGTTYFQDDLGREIESQWAPFLSAAREAPLGHESSRRAYRLVYRPSWRSPIVAIVESSKGVASLDVKVLDGQGAGKAGTLTREYSRRLRTAEWDHLSEVLKTGFWAEPSVQQPDIRVQDGSGCLIEATRWGEYHVAVGWNPRSNRFRAACRAFLDLTNEDIPVTEFAELVQD